MTTLLAGGQTGRTTAHLASALDDRFVELEKNFGQLASQLAARSHQEAIDKIEQIIQKENIECDFLRVDGYLFMADNYDEKDLRQEMEAAAHAGLELEWIENLQLNQSGFGPAVRFANQGQFDIMKYLQGLIKSPVFDKIKIFNHTRIVQIYEQDGGVTLQTQSGNMIRAKHAIMATNTPINVFAMHTKQSAYRSYVVAAKIAKDSIGQALYRDTADPYTYIRIKPLNQEFDLIIIGGQDHKTGQNQIDSDQCFENLKNWAMERFDTIQEFEYQWSGQVWKPVDRLAFLGLNPGNKNTYIITNDSGHGMTHASIGAMIICDAIIERANPYQDLYNPSRISLTATSAKEFVKENLNVVAQYTDLLTGGTVSETNQISNDSGALMRDGIHKIAVYKDENGIIYKKSAICPHLGCVVRWNDVEKSWHCPCHGSCFDAYGRMQAGPAVSDLKDIEVK